MNRVVNKCNDCRRVHCYRCKTLIDHKYKLCKLCYDCEYIKPVKEPCKHLCAKCNTPIEAKYKLCYDCKYSYKNFLESFAPAPEIIVCVDCKKPIDRKTTFVVKGHCDLCFFKIPIDTLLQA